VESSPVESDLPSRRKRRFEELDTDHVVKSEDSTSVDANHPRSEKGSMDSSTKGKVKVEYDEETSKAASILNNVSKNHLVSLHEK